MNKIVDSFVGAIGNTPLIRIRSLSERFKCNVLGKAEFMNPGGSVKDRAALFEPVHFSSYTGPFSSYMIRNAEQMKELKPHGTVVEGTAGNTGIGLAHICRALGYKCVIFMPNTQSQEKIHLLKILGADVRPVYVSIKIHAVYNFPALPYLSTIQ